MSSMIILYMIIGISVAVLIFIPLQYVAQDYLIGWALNETASTNATNTLNFFNNLWSYLLIPVIFAFIYWGITQSQRGDYQ